MRARAAVGGGVGVLGVVAVLVAAASSLLAEGCGGGGSSCSAGKEGCACNPSGLCEVGLTCASKRCVNLSTIDGGGAGTAGAGAAGTGGGMAGSSAAGTGGGMAGAGSGGAGTAGTGVAGAGTAGTGAGGSADPNAACTPLDAYCQKINECAPLAITLVYGDLAGCKARLKLSCVAQIKLADNGLTPASITACANAVATATCDDLLYRNIPACAPKGSRLAGAACGTGSQCTSTYCAATTATCGICAGLAPAGGDCTVDDDCKPQLVCGGLGLCVTPGGAGAACDDNTPCRYGYYCSGGTCAAARTTPGAPCTESGSCEILKGLFCNGTVCARILTAQPGDACGVVGGTSVAACAAGDCISSDPVNDPNSGTCTSLAGDGEACGSAVSTGVDCESPSTCTNGRCALPNGTTCN
jgi:hypothetical protein